jgi:mono/diheme cytochrome c family protein
MTRALRFVCAATAVAWMASLAMMTAAPIAQKKTPPSSRAGWTIPATADAEKSPLEFNDAMLAAGKKLFDSKCKRCHGATGKGDGVDADLKYKKEMNLTLAARAGDNPDGVVFYKIWNGRSSPKMPRFSEEFSKEQVWALVAYAQSLRAK